MMENEEPAKRTSSGFYVVYAGYINGRKGIGSARVAIDVSRCESNTDVLVAIQKHIPEGAVIINVIPDGNSLLR